MSPAEGVHTVRSFDEELRRLSTVVVRMGSLAEQQVALALRAVSERDNALAEQVVRSDPDVDQLESDVHALTFRLLALRQPVAVDLRQIIGALKISSDLERVGDYAKSVSKRALVLNQMQPVRPAAAIPRMGRMVQGLFSDVLDAYVEQDVDKALAVWEKDDELDEMYTSLFRELVTYMMEDPRNITPCTHLMFMAKNIERMGDHATNIAETIYFQVKGKPLLGDRPRGTDDDEFVVIPPTL
jgi:phosphate transport system protein